MADPIVWTFDSEDEDTSTVVYNDAGDPIDVIPIQKTKAATPKAVKDASGVEYTFDDDAPKPEKTAFDRFTQAGELAASSGLMGNFARKAYDWADYGIPALREKYPDWTEEQLEERADKILSIVDKNQLAEMNRRAEEDSSFNWAKPIDSLMEPGKWVPAVLGAVGTSADPTSLVNPGGSIIRQMSVQGGLGAVSDFGSQLWKEIDGVIDEIDPVQTVYAGLAAIGLQGAVSGLQRSLDVKSGKTDWKGRAVDKIDEELVEFGTESLDNRVDAIAPDADPAALAATVDEMIDANATDAEIAAVVEAAGGQYTPGDRRKATVAFEAAVEKGKAADIEMALEGTGYSLPREEIETFVQAREKASRDAIVRAYEEKGVPVAKADEPTTPTANDNIPEMEVEPALVPPTPVKNIAPEITPRIEKMTAGWKNAPQFNVAERLEDLAPEIRRAIVDDGAENALGFVGPDGKVHIIAQNVKNSDDLSAVVFHEALGHYGLQQKFQDRLDGLLDLLYKSNEGVRKDADAYRQKFPGAYEDDINPIARAVEEVLAEQSEGGKIDASVYQKVKAVVKQWVRDMGLDLDVSDAEVKAILAMAHNKVINGEKTSGSIPGVRYMVTYHGTPHDFDKFDHSKMGSGEGAQAFGWGTYLTESEQLAGRYRDALAGSTPTYAGVPGAWYAIRGNMEADLEAKGFSAREQDAGREFFEYVRDYGKVPKSPDDIVDNMFIAGKGSAEAGKMLTDLGRVFPYLKTKFTVKQNGKLLEVDIPDDGLYLEWDKPLGQQETLIEALKKVDVEVLTDMDYSYFERRAGDFSMEARKAEQALERFDLDKADAAGVAEYERLREDYLAKTRKADEAYEELGNYANEKHTGETVYHRLEGAVGGQKEASQFLSDLGVVGTKYLDGFSRNKGEGTYNYVIYDDNTPKITNKYMRGGDRAGPIKLSRLKSTKDIEGVLRESAKAYRPGRADTHEAIKEAAKAMKMTADELLTVVPNFDPVMMAASAEILTTSANKVARLQKQIENGNDSTAVKMAYIEAKLQNEAIFEKVANLGSYAGRLLNAVKIAMEGRSGGGAQLRYMLDNMGHDALSTPEKLDAAVDMFIKHQDDPKATRKFTRALLKPGADDIAMAVWQNGLLSDPSTHMINITGQVSAIAADIVSTAVAAVGGQGKRALAGTERVPARELASRVYGLVGALKLWDSYHTPDGDLRFKIGGTWAKSGKAFKEGTKDNTQRTGHRGYTLKGPASILEIPVRTLAMTDEFFRNVIVSMNVHGLSMRKAVNEGHTGQALKDRLAELRENTPGGILLEASDEAKVLQFLDDPTWITKGFNRLIHKTSKDGKIVRGGKFALRTQAPFVNTLDRITQMSLRYSPLGFLDRQNIADLKAGGAKRDVALGKLAIGTAFTYWVYNATMEGLLSGDGPDDLSKVEALKSQQWRPNIIKIGNERYSIKGVDPLALNIKIIATIAEKQMYDKTPESMKKNAETVATAVRSLITSMADSNWAAGIFNLVGALEGGPMGQSKFENWLAGMGGSLIPNVVRKNVNDDAIRNTTDDGTMMGRVKGRIQSGLPDWVPGIGAATDLPQQFDVYGRPQFRGDMVGPDVASRFEKTEKETDPAVLAIAELEGKTTTLIGPVKRSDLKDRIIAVEGAERDIQAQEVEDYQYLSGTYILESVREFMNSPEWNEMSDSERVKEIQDIKKDMRKAAREELYPMPEEDEEFAPPEEEWTFDE